MVSEEIDVIKLYAGQLGKFKDDEFSTAHDKWNKWLKWCVANNQFDHLMSTMHGLQRGMATAQKSSLVTQGLADMYCRWIGSIDKALRRIVKKRQTTANDFIDPTHHDAKNKKTKQQRDIDLEKYIRKMSY